MSSWPAGNTATEKRRSVLRCWFCMARVANISLCGGKQRKERETARSHCTPLPAPTRNRRTRLPGLAERSRRESQRCSVRLRQNRKHQRHSAARADCHGNVIAALPVCAVPLSLPLSALPTKPPSLSCPAAISPSEARGGPAQSPRVPQEGAPECSDSALSSALRCRCSVADRRGWGGTARIRLVCTAGQRTTAGCTVQGSTHASGPTRGGGLHLRSSNSVSP
jgi:hypothetical protein